MKRREFLKKSIPAATVIPAMLDGYSVRAFTGHSSLLQSLLVPPVETDHVLVIIQLSGGNDGLNTVIPISTYSSYYNARTNIAIPQNKILHLDNYLQAGLHPGMTGMQAMYNEGKLAILQAVGYPSPNFSHFRATDIWMTASDSNTVLNTGWGGRYLNVEYPNFPAGYPNNTMPDPLAIQIGSVTTLTCQGPVVNMGMSITDPTSFYNFVNGVPDPAPNSPMGYELSYIRDVANQTNQYAQRVKSAAIAVTQQAPYPSNNSLADQLKIVARLIKGGLKTKIYMVSYGGFDTHASQVTATDTTLGTHANLLSNLSNAVKAFTDDLYFLGVQDRVIGMTFSEFGRRIRSNASGGTDHGAAAPVFLFGKNVIRGVYGTNPAIPTNATVNDNIPFQYDFRSVYASILQNWFCVPATDLQMIMMNNYQQIGIVSTAGCAVSNPVNAGDTLIINYPNPFIQGTTISFTTRGGHTLVQIINNLGQVIRTLIDQEYTAAGTYTVPFDSYSLAAGVYYARLQNGPIQQVRTMLKVR
jgi:uncharacterized protein (DUF1501 family)